MPAANVTSVEALSEFRAALIVFAEAADSSISGLESELRRGMQWLLDVQPQFWTDEQRRLNDAVLEARVELHRCRSMALPGEVAPCSEQKHALERVIARLRHAEDKAKATRHWGHVVEHESREWQGRAKQFAHLLEADLPAAIALVDRVLRTLEAYTNNVKPRSSASTAAREGGSASTSDPIS